MFCTKCMYISTHYFMPYIGVYCQYKCIQDCTVYCTFLMISKTDIETYHTNKFCKCHQDPTKIYKYRYRLLGYSCLFCIFLHNFATMHFFLLSQTQKYSTSRPYSVLVQPVMRIRDVYPGSRIRLFPSRIPNPNCFHPGSRIRIKEFMYFNPKNGF